MAEEPPKPTELRIAQALATVLDQLHCLAGAPVSTIAEAMRGIAAKDTLSGTKSQAELTELVNKQEVDKSCTSELVAHCRWAYEQEDERRRGLDAKASILAAAVGAFAALLLRALLDILRSKSDFGGNVTPAIILCSITLALLVLTGILALLAMRLRLFSATREDNVFDVRVMETGEMYQRALAVQFWVMRRADKGANDGKARWLTICQWTFASFLVTLLILGIYLGIRIAEKP